MNKADNQILNQQQLLAKIKRIAYEIYENNVNESEMVVAGIIGTGYRFAALLAKEIESISPIKTILVQVTIDKKNPLISIPSLDYELETLQQKVIILADDVLNTGRTFIQCMRPFLSIEVKKIETTVLISRDHRLFPISSDYTGYELSTTIQEHVTVHLEDDHKAVYLF